MGISPLSGEPAHWTGNDPFMSGAPMLLGAREVANQRVSHAARGRKPASQRFIQTEYKARQLPEIVCKSGGNIYRLEWDSCRLFFSEGLDSF